MKTRKGFSLIEILIVIAISAIMSTIAIGLSNSSKNEIALSVETAKIAQFIITAKSLALASFTTSTASGICGYGVYVNAQANPAYYSIFAYKPTGAPPCPTNASTTARGITNDEITEYSPSSWQVQPAKGVVLSAAGQSNLSVVLFYPPAPITLISTSTNDPHSFGSGNGKIVIMTADGQGSSTITVNPGGQVNYQ